MDVNNLISLGIGSPASIKHFVLFGLTPTGEVAFVPFAIVEGDCYVTSGYTGIVDVMATAARRVNVATTFISNVETE